MIIYNVTVNIDEEVHEDWLDWMQEKHIPDIMDTGLFVESKLSRIIAEEQGGLSYSIMYLCENHEKLDQYQKKHAPTLQEEHTNRYRDKFVAFRTLLEVKNTF